MAGARRGIGECTVRKRADGRWEGRYKDVVTNKKKSVYAKTQKEVLAIIKEKMIEYNIGSNKAFATLDMKNWVKVWLEKYNVHIKPLTRLSYERITNTHIIPQIGDKLLIELTMPDLQDMYERLLNGRGLNPKTIKNVHGVIHKCLDKARVLGYIQKNVADDVVLPRTKKPQIVPIEENIVPLFVEEAMKDKYADIFIVTMFTGMRQGEVLGLSWRDIDFAKGTITINNQLQKISKKGGGYFLASTKNDKERIIAPADIVIDVLKKRQKEQNEDKRKAGRLWEAKGEFADLVFTHETGKHFAHGTVYKHCKRILNNIGLPESRFHDLRHSYAVISLQNGDDIKTVQENLGHHSAAFTLDTYAHMTNKMRYESAKRMNDFVEQMQHQSVS